MERKNTYVGCHPAAKGVRDKEFVRSEKSQDESSPNFQIFVPNFVPNFAPDFPRMF